MDFCLLNILVRNEFYTDSTIVPVKFYLKVEEMKHETKDKTKALLIVEWK